MERLSDTMPPSSKMTRFATTWHKSDVQKLSGGACRNSSPAGFPCSSTEPRDFAVNEIFGSKDILPLKMTTSSKSTMDVETTFKRVVLTGSQSVSIHPSESMVFYRTPRDYCNIICTKTFKMPHVYEWEPCTDAAGTTPMIIQTMQPASKALHRLKELHICPKPQAGGTTAQASLQQYLQQYGLSSQPQHLVPDEYSQYLEGHEISATSQQGTAGTFQQLYASVQPLPGSINSITISGYSCGPSQPPAAAPSTGLLRSQGADLITSFAHHARRVTRLSLDEGIPIYASETMCLTHPWQLQSLKVAVLADSTPFHLQMPDGLHSLDITTDTKTWAGISSAMQGHAGKMRHLTIRHTGDGGVALIDIHKFTRLESLQLSGQALPSPTALSKLSELPHLMKVRFTGGVPVADPAAVVRGAAACRGLEEMWLEVRKEGVAWYSISSSGSDEDDEAVGSEACAVGVPAFVLQELLSEAACRSSLRVLCLKVEGFTGYRVGELDWLLDGLLLPELQEVRLQICSDDGTPVCSQQELMQLLRSLPVPHVHVRPSKGAMEAKVVHSRCYRRISVWAL